MLLNNSSALLLILALCAAILFPGCPTFDLLTSLSAGFKSRFSCLYLLDSSSRSAAALCTSGMLRGGLEKHHAMSLRSKAAQSTSASFEISTHGIEQSILEITCHLSSLYLWEGERGMFLRADIILCSTKSAVFVLLLHLSYATFLIFVTPR